jgi:ferredoxin
MRVSIDSTACSGHGLCYVDAPTLFADDDQGFPEVIGDGTVTSNQEQSARRAAANCPEGAIRVDE